MWPPLPLSCFFSPPNASTPPLCAMDVWISSNAAMSWIVETHVSWWPLVAYEPGCEQPDNHRRNSKHPEPRTSQNTSSAHEAKSTPRHRCRMGGGIRVSTYIPTRSLPLPARRPQQLSRSRFRNTSVGRELQQYALRAMREARATPAHGAWPVNTRR